MAYSKDTIVSIYPLEKGTIHFIKCVMFCTVRSFMRFDFYLSTWTYLIYWSTCVLSSINKSLQQDSSKNVSAINILFKLYCTEK